MFLSDKMRMIFEKSMDFFKTEEDGHIWRHSMSSFSQIMKNGKIKTVDTHKSTFHFQHTFNTSTVPLFIFRTLFLTLSNTNTKQYLLSNYLTLPENQSRITMNPR